MIAAFALAQASLLVRPTYASEEPPELRSAQHILLLHTGVPDVHPAVTQDHESALAFARELARQLADGADFAELARRHSMARSAARGAVLGTFGPGMLEPELDAFLFSADVGDVSAPLDTDSGVHLLRRVETYAGVRQILFAGPQAEARERCRTVQSALAAGADFGDLARRYSDDAESAAHDGEYQVFERGPDDRLLKQAVFDAALGEVIGPIETPLGLHLLERVPVDAIDPALAESNWIRLRAILVAYNGALYADGAVRRGAEAAKALATDLSARIRAGEDMARLAAEFDDDRGGRERAGDLGWVHRGTPGLPAYLEAMFPRPVGALAGPLETTAGQVILRRER